MNYDLLEVDKLHFNRLRDSVNEKRVEDLFDYFIKRFSFESIMLEGTNVLTESEVAHLIKTKIIVSELIERDQKEVLNYVKAFQFIFEMVKLRKKLNEEILKDIHEILTEGILIGGRYRQVNITIKNSMHQPPNHLKVYDRMEKLFYDLDNFKGNAIQKGAFAQSQILKIYPFLDGNGRLSRLILNYYLMFEGYMPVSIPLNLKEEYFKSVDIFKEQKLIKPIEEFFYKLLLEQYEDYIIFLEEGNINGE